MKKTFRNSFKLAAAAAFGTICFAGTALGAEEAPSIVNSVPVTKVLAGGEAPVAIRLEFSEEVPANSVYYSVGAQTFSMVSDYDIQAIYVSESGELGDAASVSGKYCFIEFTASDADTLEYTEHVTFNEGSKYRDQVVIKYAQNIPITTVSGGVIDIAPERSRNKQASSRNGEIRIGIDDYQEIQWTDPETGCLLYGYLYVPEDTQDELPLIVHFPSGDRSYTEWDGGYRGAMFTHQDVVCWSTPEAQKRNPSYVLTVGVPQESSEAYGYEMYLRFVKDIIEEYNVDEDRIYAVALAGGSTQSFLAASETDLFAAEICSGSDMYGVWKTTDECIAGYENLIDKGANWVFVGYDDTTGFGDVTDMPDDNRTKGMRNIDLAESVNADGKNVIYTPEDQLWNGLLRGEAATEQAQVQIDQAAEAGSDDLITVFAPNTLLLNGHCTWNYAFINPAVQDWLFNQSK